ncbi:MAG: hypothetical protein ACO1QB_17080 [Verrucomicrobiales bacterium]
MNQPPLIRSHSPFRSFWIAVLIIPCVLVMAGLVYVASFFFITGETRALRNAVLEGHSGYFERVVEVNTGRASLVAARLGLSLIKEAPPEAGQMLSALKKGEVAVYKVRNRFHLDPVEILRNTDSAMEKRGFYRVVGVFEREHFVAVYLQNNTKNPEKLNVCVATLDRDNMVCVSAEADLEPLWELLREKSQSGEFGAFALR